MIYRLIFFCFLALVTLTTSPIAHAQPNIYFSGGMNLGQTDTYHRIDVVPITLSRDLSDVGLRVGAGVEFGRWLGFEAGWVDLGSTSGTAELITTCPGGCPPGTEPEILDLKAKASTFWVAYAPSFEGGRWRIHTTIGAARIKREIRGNEPWLSESSTELLLGVGATLALSEIFGLRLDLQRFGDVSTAAGVSATIRLR